MTVLAVKGDPVQPSASQQLPAAKGAGGGGEAFKSAALVQPHVVHSPSRVGLHCSSDSLLYGRVYTSVRTCLF